MHVKKQKSKRNNTGESSYNETQIFLTEHSFKINYTDKQKSVINFLRSNNISCLTGDPGTGKSFISIYYALMMLQQGAINRIVISKPLVEVGKSMGFLPGSEAEKFGPYLDSYLAIFNKIVGKGTTDHLLKNKKIVFEPINFVRGVTYEHDFVILDEAQNATLHEIITFITRCSDNTPVILLGDTWQADIRNSGFSTFVENFTDINDIGFMELGEEYQMRSKLITDIYKKYKQILAKS
jgi:phosphate starvation-inducible PhoH-like protein